MTLNAGLTSYSVRYKFELLPLDHTKDCTTLTDEERNVSPPPSVDASQREITVVRKGGGDLRSSGRIAQSSVREVSLFVEMWSSRSHPDTITVEIRR